MQFFSVNARQRLVLKTSSVEMLKMEDGTYHQKKVPGLTVEFEPTDPASQGFVWYGSALQTHDGRIRGTYSTNDSTIINLLRTHPAYGSTFIGVDADGAELVNEDYFFMDMPDGSVMFTLTGKRFQDRRGAMGWKQSNAFKAAIDKVRQQVKGELFNL